MRYQNDINSKHKMKSIGRAAVAQGTKRLTRNVQTRVRIWEAHIFDITLDFFISLFQIFFIGIRKVTRLVSCKMHNILIKSFDKYFLKLVGALFNHSPILLLNV